MGRPRLRAHAGFLLVAATVLLAAGCQWEHARYDAANTGFNPSEGLIGPGNVATLHEGWSSTVLGGHTLSVPIVSGSRVFVADLSTGSGVLAAFDARGIDGCTSSPRVCSPLWTTTGVYAQPFVANGFVFANGGGKVRAFDPAGGTNCSGTPTVCQPVWSAAPNVTDAVAVGSEIYGFASNGGVGVFDANGVQGCSGTPTVCAPLRTFAPPPCPDHMDHCVQRAISVEGDDVVISGRNEGGFGDVGGYVAGYDRVGSAGCSVSPTTCVPRWVAEPGAPDAPAAILDGVTYQPAAHYNADPDVPGRRSSVTALRQADGQVIWTGGLPGDAHHSTGVAVGGGWVHVAVDDGLYTFPVDPGSCTTNCPPSHRATITPTVLTPPSVANGVVFLGTTTGVVAYAAGGSTGCSGTPTTSAPLVTVPVGRHVQTLAVASGNVYVTTSDGTLRAFTVA